MSIEFFGIENQFTQEEAVNLLNSHVVKKGDEEKAKTSIEYIGFIAGVLTLNDEIEVVIKFPNKLSQFTKIAFNNNFSLIDMP